MDVGQVQNAMVGMALFDAWSQGLDKMIKASQSQQGDPLIAAAFAAFEQYIDTVEVQHGAMIAGAAAMVQGSTGQPSGYALNPQGSGVMSTSQMAPLLALNVMA